MNARCPTPVEIERAYFESDAAIQAHAERCERCGREWADVADLRSLARSSPSVPADHHDEIRSRLTRGVRAAVPAPRWTPKVMAVAAALAFAYVAYDRLPSGPIHRGRVTALDEAKLWLVSAQPDELVRLQDGAIMVDVDSLEPNERFRVVTSDAEVEVIGTTFDVTADRDHLRSVRVISGRVEIRVLGQTVATLSAGERWSAPEEVAVMKVEPVEPPIAPPVPVELPKKKAPLPRVANVEVEASKAPPAPKAPPAIGDYEDGWSLLREGRFDEAAAKLDRAAIESPDAATREDATFFAAVSRARGGHEAEAIRSFDQFLTLYGSSDRAGEARAMVGWLLFDAGETQRALEMFQRASTDPSARVSQSGARGLEAVRSRAHRPAETLTRDRRH